MVATREWAVQESRPEVGSWKSVKMVSLSKYLNSQKPYVNEHDARVGQQFAGNVDAFLLAARKATLADIADCCW